MFGFVSEAVRKVQVLSLMVMEMALQNNEIQHIHRFILSILCR